MDFQALELPFLTSASVFIITIISITLNFYAARKREEGYIVLEELSLMSRQDIDE